MSSENLKKKYYQENPEFGIQISLDATKKRLELYRGKNVRAKDDSWWDLTVTSIFTRLT